jgi:hypothetical protein
MTIHPPMAKSYATLRAEQLLRNGQRSMDFRFKVASYRCGRANQSLKLNSALESTRPTAVTLEAKVAIHDATD